MPSPSSPRNARAYAAAPIHVTLDARDAEPEIADEAQVLLAEVEVTEGDFLDDLILVVEHDVAGTRYRMTWLIDASNPPEDLVSSGSPVHRKS